MPLLRPAASDRADRPRFLGSASAGGTLSENDVQDCEQFGILVTGGAGVTGVRILDNVVERVTQWEGIFLNVSCSTAVRNFVRETGNPSINDFVGYNRVVLNDVDGQVVSNNGDTDCDLHIDFADLTRGLGAWGSCVGPVEECEADLDGDGFVGFGDLVILLANWS